MEIIDIKNDELELKGKMLVDFYASWCGPCKMLAPVLEEIKDEIQILKVDVDENPNLSKEFGVMSVPTLIYFKNKEEFEKKIGYMTKDDILKWIKK